MIGREKEIEEIEKHISHRHSVLIIGKKGIGRTTILKFFRNKKNACYVESSNVKQILQTMINHFDIESKRSPKYLSAQEMLEILMPHLDQPIILMVDDLSYASKLCGKVLEKLEKSSVVIIGSSSKKIRNFRFRKEIELEPLTQNESKIIAEKHLRKLGTPIILDLIATKSLGVPGKIVEICNDLKIFYQKKEIDITNQKSVFNFFKDIKPEFPERIDILPLWFLFVLGFGALLIRTILYSKGNFQDAYTIAAFGYLTLIVYRIVAAKRYKK